MELSLIGLQNAGKTSLVNVVATGGFHEDMIPTVGFNMRKVTKGAVTIKLWDLGGQVPSSTFVCPVCPLAQEVLMMEQLGRRIAPRPWSLTAVLRGATAGDALHCVWLQVSTVVTHL